MDRWRCPPSHRTVTTVCPGPSRRAAFTAPTQFIAALLPTNRPSLRRRYRACWRVQGGAGGSVGAGAFGWSIPRVPGVLKTIKGKH